MTDRRQWIAIPICLLTAACGASVTVGGASISKADVESKAKDALTRQVGQAPQSVTCPSDLNATAGASERCTLTDNAGSTLGMTVTVDTVDASGNYTFHVAVDGASPSPSVSNTSPTS